ncbi:MAG: HAD family hydrolase [Firmicutes bacterium]|nr:HAD family hydrolase [Bacillota bacterium]
MKPRALIFDFDDTLVFTNVFYDQLRQVLFEEMDRLGLGFRDQWPPYLNQADLDNIAQAGRLVPWAFPRAMRSTGEHFAALSGVELPQGAADRFEAIGWSLFDMPVPVREGAVELLTGLQGRLPLYLLTVGEPEYQQPRIDRSGLASYFDEIRIVREKTPQVFRNLLAEKGLDPDEVWMVGNSVRSDVNPALAAGLNVAHLQVAAWSYDLADPVAHCHTIHKLLELRELIEL